MLCFVLTSLLATSEVIAQAAHSSGTVEAIWRTQTMDFHYRSDSQYITCAEFETKLSTTLLAIGVYRDMTIAALCPRELSGRVRARITLASPIEATDQNLQSVTTFTGTERLLAHLTQKTLPTPGSIERFPAQWRTVSLRRNTTVSIGTEDCEFLRALSKQVLPQLSVRVIRDVSGCMAARIPPRLIVEALVPVQMLHTANDADL